MRKAERLRVSDRTIIQRINRKLASENQKLKKRGHGQRRGDLGDYYIVDSRNNSIMATHVDLMGLGQELEVLDLGETIVFD